MNATTFNPPLALTKTSTMFGVEAMERIDFDGTDRIVMLVLASDGNPSPDAATDLSPRGARELAAQLVAAADLAEGNQPLPSITPTQPNAGRA